MGEVNNPAEGLKFSPHSHMVNRLIFNGVTDADVLINVADKLTNFIGESRLFDKSTPQERSLCSWRRLMVDQLMKQGLSDADLIINTINKLYDFLISKMKEDQKKTLDAFSSNALKVSGCMPAGTIVYTESGDPIKLINPTNYQG